MAKYKEQDDIVGQYDEAFIISEKYLAILQAEILQKGFVGKPTDDKTIDDVVDFLHSEDVAGMIRKGLGSRAQDITDKELLQRYGIPKHRIKKILEGYESVTDNVLNSLVNSMSSALHAELTSHHPAALADIAYEDDEAAKGILAELYRTSGGDQFAAEHAKEIKKLKGVDALHDFMTDLYRNRTLQDRARSDHERRKPPVYDSKAA